MTKTKALLASATASALFFSFALSAFASENKTEAFVCPVITQEAVGVHNPQAQAIAGGDYTVIPGKADSLTVPEIATNDDGAGAPDGDHLAPGDDGYTAIWAVQD